MLSKGTSNDSVSFNFIPNPLVKGRSRFGDVQVPQDTELLRSRARAEMRRAGSKPLWFPPHPGEAPARGERALWGECDYEAMNSWHLRKYSTQVVSYTKRTF